MSFNIEEYYKQMVGFEIVGFKMDGEGIDAWPVFTVKKGDDTLQMVVSRDPEGNGPGFVFIENEDGQQMA
tara:strand:- start:1282 stop:1491 length:210 start_codon:yes stop_codon:yes gene_type:complete